MLFFFKQKTAYEMRISDWSSDVCSSDLDRVNGGLTARQILAGAGAAADPPGFGAEGERLPMRDSLRVELVEFGGFAAQFRPPPAVGGAAVGHRRAILPRLDEPVVASGSVAVTQPQEQIGRAHV